MTAEDTPILRQFKLLSTLLRLEPLVEQLKPLTHKVILYGSCSKGTNAQGSDIDLLIVTTQSNKKAIEKLLIQETEKLIQTSIKTTMQWATLEDRDPTYFKEILKGITLWDKQKSYD